MSWVQGRTHRCCLHQLRGGRSSSNVVSRAGRRRRQKLIAYAQGEQHCDVVVVGAGIIGLCCARSILKADPGISVTLVDRAGLCQGATGAGQGYTWLAHRNPASAAWRLATWSRQLWLEYLAAADGLCTLASWQECGSILLGSSISALEELCDRQAILAEAGVHAELLDSKQLASTEPALRCTVDSAGLYVPTDAQLNGRQAAELLLRQSLSEGRRFNALLQQGLEEIHIDDHTGAIKGICCGDLRITCSAVVLAAGAWTGQLLDGVSSLADHRWHQRLLPRRGHLLELQAPPSMPPVKHGLMELEYTQHYSAAPVDIPADDAGAAVTFTATTSATGSLLLGSSREFSGWESTPSPEVIAAILTRAATFLPDLAQLSLTGLPLRPPWIRVGLRPFCTAMHPLIGPLPTIPGLYVAAGHEGSGLTLGPATGELIAQYILAMAAVPDWAQELLPQY